MEHLQFTFFAIVGHEIKNDKKHTIHKIKILNIVSTGRFAISVGRLVLICWRCDTVYYSC